MAITTIPIEEAVERWAAETAMAVREAVENPRNQEQYDWGLGFAAMYLRKVGRKANRQGVITLSAALLRQLGLEVGNRVIVVPLAEGGAFIRRATGEDVMAAHRQYAATPPPVFPHKPTPAELPEIEKCCQQCALTYRTREHRRRFCDDCKRERGRASARRRWHRNGKLTPSYQRKLKSGRLAGLSPARGNAAGSLPVDDKDRIDAAPLPALAG